MKNKRYSMTLTEEEREWFHELANTEKKSIAIMIIECFRKKSEKLGITLPVNTIPGNKRKYRENDHSPPYKDFYLREIKEENFQMNFI